MVGNLLVQLLHAVNKAIFKTYIKYDQLYIIFAVQYMYDLHVHYCTERNV